MTLRPRRRIRRTAGGHFELNLPRDERALLQALPGQLTGSLSALEGDQDPGALRRLLPTAHPRDTDAEAAFRVRHRDALLEHHLSALETLAKTADARQLDLEQLQGWLDALNDLRLVLGTTLGVTEDPSEPDPDAPDYADWVCYHYLSFLQSEVIDVLDAELPAPDPMKGEDLPEDPWGEPLGGLRWDGTPLPGSDQ